MPEGKEYLCGECQAPVSVKKGVKGWLHYACSSCGARVMAHPNSTAGKNMLAAV